MSDAEDSAGPALRSASHSHSRSRSRSRSSTLNSSASVQSFADALSETTSAVALAPRAGEAARRQRETQRLLADADDGVAPRTSRLSKTVATWVRSAAQFITLETRPLSAAAPAPAPRALSRSASRNIIHRNSIPSELLPAAEREAAPKVVDATDSICSYPNCVQSLNIAVSRFHCRKCNGWYCIQHAGHPSFGMRLIPGSGESSASAGLWSRVCQLCFYEKFHRPDPSPPRQSLLAPLVERRRALVAAAEIGTRRLEHRLQRLAEYRCKPADKAIPFRLHERKVVEWQDDNASPVCSVCCERFSALRRKHHCRLCGSLICAEPSCTLFFPLRLHGDGGAVELRVCTVCERRLFRRKMLQQELEHTGSLVALYAELRQVQRQIGDIIPRFNDQLLRFEHEIDRAEPVERKLVDARHEASAARDTLMLLFRHYDALAKKIKCLVQDESSQELLLHANIYRAARLYLQNNMFTLQMLPKLDLKRIRPPPASDVGAGAEPPSQQNPQPGGSFLPRILGSLLADKGTSAAGIAIPPPANLAALQEKVGVLHEQKMQLEGFLAEAVKTHSFEDVRSLRLSLEEICGEIARTTRMCREIDPDGLF